jgi:hypothetical protein
VWTEILRARNDSTRYEVTDKIPGMWTEEFFGLLKASTLNESHFVEAIAFKEQHLPKRIYKYRSDNEYARTRQP